MQRRLIFRSSTVLLILVGAAVAWVFSARAAVNEDKASASQVVAPGGVNDVAAPSDAIVLFDGSNYDAWESDQGEVKWQIEGDTMVVTKTGYIHTKQQFGDMQLHLEFATPSEPKGTGQGRGNSGVYIQGRYEVQVLDSFENETYPNGQCGAVYGQYPPLVNASNKPGAWQSYDMIFHAAKVDSAGNVTAKPRITVLHNGVLIQDNVEIQGTTTAAKFNDIQPLGSLYLQDHGNPVRYRNVWIRELQ